MNGNNNINITVWLTNKVPEFAFQRSHATRIRKALPNANITVCSSKQSFFHNLKKTDVAIVWHFKAEWLEYAPRLHWIATPAAGKDDILFQPPNGRKLYFSFGSFHGKIMADSVVGWLLALNRGLLDAVKKQSEGDCWPRVELAALQNTIPGSRAVIVGFGRIGNAIGARLKPFGINVTGLRRNVSAKKPSWFKSDDCVRPMSDLDKVLPTADHLIMVLPRAPETDNLINTKRLEKLKPNAVIYNVGRGNSIDEKAVIKALKSKRLRAACLDVFKQEPLPEDSALIRVPNLFVLPHLTACAPEYLDLFLNEFIQQFIKKNLK